METIIIGQGYNIKENTSVGKELVEQFNSKRYKSFTCLVAFASYGGISAMTPYIETAKSEGVAIKVVLGVDQKGTSKEALEEVLSWDVDASIYHTKSINIFHPKIYLFENEDIFTMIVGSNNLTEMGLVKNVECSLLIKDIKSNPVHGEFYNYWKNILDGKDINLYPITQDLIEKLYKDSVVTSESQRSKRYDNGEDEQGETKQKSVSFKKTEIQKNPEGFRHKRLLKIRQLKKDGTLGEITESQSVTVLSKNYRFELRCDETTLPYPSGDDRPIGLFVKEDDKNYMYQVLMPSDDAYKKIKDYLYLETANQKGRKDLMRRYIADVEAIHALYPELIV